MPHGATARVKSRVAQAQRLIEERGCVSTSIIASAVGGNTNEAYYAARLLERGGAVLQVALGQHSLWCAGREAAEAVLWELKKELARVLCRSGARYATPIRAYKLITADKQARAAFLRYVPLEKTTASLINALLHQIFGEPIRYRYRGTQPVYYVPPETCRKMGEMPV
jgi:hypothetical protein